MEGKKKNAILRELSVLWTDICLDVIHHLQEAKNNSEERQKGGEGRTRRECEKGHVWKDKSENMQIN